LEIIWKFTKMMNRKPFDEVERQKQLDLLGFWKNPMDENFLDMIKISVFPFYKLLSFTSLVVLADTTVFVFCMIYDQLDASNGFLAPSQYTLFHLGYSDRIQMLNGQYYRFITPIFIYQNFLHFFFSVFIKIYFLSFVEYIQGFLKTIFIYLLISTYGVIFNAVLTSRPAVGGSFCIGIILISLMQEHNIFQQTKNSNLYAFFSSSHESSVLPTIKLLFILMIVYVANQVYPKIPIFGHCGSYLMGYLLTKFFAPEYPKEPQKNYIWLFLSLTLYIGTIIFLFLFLKDKDNNFEQMEG
ncbi:hypothetical protein ABPG74_018143, partial [Tetrahymena malaccensis]